MLSLRTTEILAEIIIGCSTRLINENIWNNSRQFILKLTAKITRDLFIECKLFSVNTTFFGESLIRKYCFSSSRTIKLLLESISWSHPRIQLHQLVSENYNLSHRIYVAYFH